MDVFRVLPKMGVALAPIDVIADLRTSLASVRDPDTNCAVSPQAQKEIVFPDYARPSASRRWNQLFPLTSAQRRVARRDAMTSRPVALPPSCGTRAATCGPVGCYRSHGVRPSVLHTFNYILADA
ncbi:hypothetical protein C2E23DRAFT_464509 [Lenzites betulinus]|nr:hypothetical protein C2E23DRAFT_464509 [Lenzites betulinus]